jgi:hypothetical protein
MSKCKHKWRVVKSIDDTPYASGIHDHEYYYCEKCGLPYHEYAAAKIRELESLLSGGINLIGKERQRQIKELGWTKEHDKTANSSGELALAAIQYAIPPQYRDEECVKEVFPWEWKYWHPTPNNRILELTKAGALIAAEIDRLQGEGQ